MSDIDTITNAHILFSGAIPTGTTVYVPIPVKAGCIGAFIGWPDAVSSATITLELTSNMTVSPVVAGTAAQWKDSGVSITGPAASAAGSSLVNVENVRQRRARIKIVTAAATTLDIRDGIE